MSADLLRIDELSVTYRTRRRDIRAVNGATLTVARGETVAIVGESGSGKSSIVNAILGLSRTRTTETTGAISIAGTPVIDMSERGLAQIRGKIVGYIPQDPVTSLNPVKRIHRQIGDAIHAHDRHVDRDAARARILAALEAAGIPDPDRVAQAYPHELSGGLKQRVLIAIAMVNDPLLLIADEPTSALDVTAQKVVLDRIDELGARRGLGVLLVTHDLGVANERADRIYVMSKGSIVDSGSGAEIARSTVPFTRELLVSAPTAASTRLLPHVSPVSPVTAREPAPRLTASDLVRDYTRGARTTRAIDGATFELCEGRTHALVGESGSGKSTVARIVVGLTLPSSGTLTLDGAPLDWSTRRSAAARRSVGFVHQNPFSSLDPRQRVVDVIAEPLVNFDGLRRRDRDAAVTPILESVGLDSSHLHARPGELSGGQRQRVAIARALAVRPRVLVLDEPVSALDVIVQARILQLLVDLQASHDLAYLFISHDLAVVRQIADTVTVLRRGETVEQGTVEQVLRAPRHEYTKLLLDAVPAGFGERESPRLDDDPGEFDEDLSTRLPVLRRT